MINISASFAAAANAAFGATLPVPFSPYGSDVMFLLGAFIFEDVGVTAYKAAAPLLTNNAFVGPAAGIMAVEAYHAGAVRASLLKMALTYVFPYNTTVAGITSAIATLRAGVDGLVSMTCIELVCAPLHTHWFNVKCFRLTADLAKPLKVRSLTFPAV